MPESLGRPRGLFSERVTGSSGTPPSERPIGADSGLGGPISVVYLTEPPKVLGFRVGLATLVMEGQKSLGVSTKGARVSGGRSGPG